ncbi:alpha/beta fold hydrolase [Algibacter lectus]|uniref:2-hydroxy-6-oxo-6-phenylhexa-2,4-dienoate hydrolase n=1 Tax=Algibacter lectus TaxID=221126 RepID=A0A090WZB7_9FLAO|nr:alpha/beta fold hydrolase [Algibacter lectus]MDO7138075.1 alpha/beta fold hydrolase [Algibacter lectus]MWW26391.1 alpha/beta fold hydrolase [Algibacter lectus]TDY60025.1 pimeloyl-ACP methyl ester carboxylesterase [Algibacter lectus]SFD41155.1 Pimeloyl-ACP methyl ester carboxylesterase [Algibacter lectus]GAL80774.1 2-hydroxy-6-oxo-6-phenylhexa-2,4-dienoate hydrolase [Algibacter lectus]
MEEKRLLHSNILGEGKPFVILHGFLGMSDNWKTHGKHLSEQGFEVHLVDQRNHGRSFWDANFSYEVLAEDLKTYCEAHNLKDITLLGHSMGGKTAMLFACEYPELVSKLIVADISPRFYPVHHDGILAGLSALNFDVIKTRGEADTALSGYVDDIGTRQFLLKNLYWIEKGKLALRINLDVLKEEVSEVGEALPSYSNFDKPALFMRGDRSEYIGVGDEAIIKNHFSDFEIVTIANAGHWLHAENPKDFFAALLNFI